MSLIRKRKIHFVGIGGIGMSGIAELLLGLGHKVSGSDSSKTEITENLQKLGASVVQSHEAKWIDDFNPDVVVHSAAVKFNNPEILRATEKSIPVIRRAEMLAEIMRLKRGIAIAGSHGKTTTTGLLAQILKEAGLDPTVVIGGKFDAIGSNAKWGGGDWMVAEADESDGSFLRLSPELAVITNIDKEHLDHYRSLDNQVAAFAEFLDRLPFYGRAVLCSDCPRVRGLLDNIKKPASTYGMDPSYKPQFLIEIMDENGATMFQIKKREGELLNNFCRVKLKVPGKHNALNATAALVVSLDLGVPLEIAVRALENFEGVKKRFELRGHLGRRHPIIEDYAHHPTEISATLQAAINFYSGSKINLIFQPHRFSRTRDLWPEFKNAFVGASKTFTMPIYAASETQDTWTKEFDGENFAKHVSAIFTASHSEALEKIKTHYKNLNSSGDKIEPLLVLGAGDISKIIPEILKF